MKIKYSILAGLLFAVIMFIYLVITAQMDIAIVVSAFIFVVSPFLFYFKMFSKVDFSAKFQKIDKNLIIYDGITSHLKDGITVGGTLYLMDDKLIFQTNSINFLKRHEQTIFLNQITEVAFVKTLGLVNNGLLIKIKNNQNEQFVVNKRTIWKAQIDNYLIDNTNR